MLNDDYPNPSLGEVEIEADPVDKDAASASPDEGLTPHPADLVPAGPEATGPEAPAPDEPAVLHLSDSAPKVVDPSGMERIKKANAIVRVCREEVHLAEEKLEGAKGELKLAKAELDEAVARLQKIIDAETTPCPLFDGLTPTASDAPSADDAQAAPPAAAASADAAANDWRAVPLSEAIGKHVTDTLLARLAEADLTTVGALSDYTANGGQLTDIKGVGDIKAEKIEQAMEHFWTTWNDALAEG